MSKHACREIGYLYFYDHDFSHLHGSVGIEFSQPHDDGIPVAGSDFFLRKDIVVEDQPSNRWNRWGSTKSHRGKLFI